MIVSPILSGLEFHHIGVACQNLDREAASFATMGYQFEGDSFEDRTQGIRGRFLTGNGPRLELVAPLTQEPGVLTNMLARGVKMYHFAYFTPDIGHSLAEVLRVRGKIMVEPVPATAFGGRRISFVFLPNLFLIEFIEN